MDWLLGLNARDTIWRGQGLSLAVTNGETWQGHGRTWQATTAHEWCSHGETWQGQWCSHGETWQGVARHGRQMAFAWQDMSKVIVVIWQDRARHVKVMVTKS